MSQNGQQKAQQNLEAFKVWQATQTDDDFKQIIHRGQLNRGEIANAVGCGKSALNQNPALKDALIRLENRLRERGVLPFLTEITKKDADKPKKCDNTSNHLLADAKRLSALETENIELRAKLSELEKSLQRFGELSETLSEMGFIPR